jgi:hypothetical protein
VFDGVHWQRQPNPVEMVQLYTLSSTLQVPLVRSLTLLLI